MRNLYELDRYRFRHASVMELFGGYGDHETGVFHVPSPRRGWLKVIATANGAGWDHVSVSCEGRCPVWAEMEHVKRLFFLDTETAMQLHVPPSEHINYHPHCLHLWRPVDRDIPVPPAALVGAPL